MEGTPAVYNIDAIEPSTIILIKDEDFRKLCARLDEMQVLYRMETTSVSKPTISIS